MMNNNFKDLKMKIKSKIKSPTRLVLVLVMSLLYLVLLSMQYTNSPKTQITIKSNQTGLITGVIQKAIDSCAANGGGEVIFPSGTYLIGGLELKSNVTLHLEKGALLQGSSKYADYKNDALINGKDITNVTILGAGTIDGVDCYNPKGEEGFRGPHTINLLRCSNITLRNFTIVKSANYAIRYRHCSNAIVDSVSIFGGHAAIDTRFGKNFIITNCDFRTGDDVFAGNDNRNIVITDCKINTSCNGFRIGCYNFTVQRCKIWGPGEYVHMIQKRNNTLAAFVHFSPKDEKPSLLSGNWLIQDIAVDHVDNFFNYNFNDGVWQTGMPMTSIRFENIQATGLLKAFTIIGDKDRQLKLTIANSSFSFREGAAKPSPIFEDAKLPSNTFFNATSFDFVELQNVTLQKNTKAPIVEINSGNTLIMNTLLPASLRSSNGIKEIKQIIK